MNTMIALPIAAAVPTAAAATPAEDFGLDVAPSMASDKCPDRDDELIDLCGQITELRKRYIIATGITRSCHDAYESVRPEKPKTLLWSLGDPVTYSRGPTHHENGKEYLWCSTGEIENLRGRQFKQWRFVGSDADLKKLGLQSKSDADGMPPVKGHEHLFESRPDKHRTRRAAELIAALDEYSSKDAAAFDASGYSAAEEIEDGLMSKMDEIYRRIADIEATSPEGLKAQAISLITHCWGGTISAPEYEEDYLLRRIMSSLSGMPIQPADQDPA